MKINKLDYDYLAKFLLEEIGMDLGPDRSYLLEARLDPLLEKKGLNYQDVIDSLKLSNSNALLRELIDAITTHETMFFRDENFFETFRLELIPELLKKRTVKTLKIWSAGCSYGQEPYSIGMLLKEILDPEWSAFIDGTDVGTETLERARNGVYSDFEVGRGLNNYYRSRYFQPHPEGWRINSDFRSMIKFFELNLVKDFNHDFYDIIFCRYVLIYFSPEVRARVVEKLVSSLRPGGYLVLGGSEALYEQIPSLQRIQRDLSVYKKAD